MQLEKLENYIFQYAIAEANGGKLVDYVSGDGHREEKGEDIMKRALETVKKKEDRKPRFDRKDRKPFNKSSDNKSSEKSEAQPKKVQKTEEKPSVKEEVKEVQAEETKKADVDLSTKNVAELREMAKEKGLKGYSTMKKADLIEALK